MIELLNQDDALGDVPEAMRVTADGRFRFWHIPPGRYALVLTQRGRSSPSPMLWLAGVPEAEAAIRGDAHFLRHVAERVVLVQELNHGVMIRTGRQPGDRAFDAGQPGVRQTGNRPPYAPRRDRSRLSCAPLPGCDGRPARNHATVRCEPGVVLQSPRRLLRGRRRRGPGRQAGTLARPVHLQLEALRVVERAVLRADAQTR